MFECWAKLHFRKIRTHHHGAKLGVKMRIHQMCTERHTHNSTSPGFPFPMTLSKLSGPRSSTLEAPAPVRRAAATKDREINIVVEEDVEKVILADWSSSAYRYMQLKFKLPRMHHVQPVKTLYFSFFPLHP